MERNAFVLDHEHEHGCRDVKCKPAINNTFFFLCVFVFRASEIAHFQQVLQHPAYKANPLAAISEHIKNAVQREQESQT